ncbi:hypothetical protein BYT27DRAFT_7198187 [Phlegmacium glaucopus]|nr:hypothetical protein BYT27DRAFT_7198187 [Phlegmacium glaucopus]
MSSVQAKNEGVNLNWAFAPPPGTVLLKEEDADAGEFDWDTINDDEDLELCLIRIPDSVKPKYLENVQLHMPISSSSSTPSQNACVGILKRKHTTFDIWAVGNDGEQPIGGEELKSLSCLLPRKKKKGKLYPAPKPFTHHLLISAQSVVPTPYASSSSSTQPSEMTGPPYKNPPRQSYPKEVLKHQFMPYGSLVNVTNNDDEMDTETHEGMNVDIETPEPQPTLPPKTKRKKGKVVDEIHLETPLKPSTATEAEPEGKKAKGKKRKGEGTDTAESPAPKKSKKFKTRG